MKKLIFSAAVALCASLPAQAADVSDGTILAFDRKARVIVFTDKTVFPLDKVETDIPEDLKAGDRVEISYESNEDDGVNMIYSIKKIAQ